MKRGRAAPLARPLFIDVLFYRAVLLASPQSESEQRQNREEGQGRSGVTAAAATASTFVGARRRLADKIIALKHAFFLRGVHLQSDDVI